MLLVAAGLIYRDGQILITQRPPGKHGALKWEFPGGKVDEEEDPRRTIHREVQEELGIQVEVHRVVDVVFHRYPDRAVLLLLYKCVWISGEAETLDCHAFAWVEPSRLTEFDFLDADLELIQRLAEAARKQP